MTNANTANVHGAGALCGVRISLIDSMAIPAAAPNISNATTAPASASARPYPNGYRSSGSRLAMRSPLHTTREPTISVPLSIASATNAYAFPSNPATSFTTARIALIASPIWASRCDDA